jgi:N-acyl homoserine lactone hydrolase
MSKFLIRPIPLCQGTRDKSQFTYHRGMNEKVVIVCYVWYLQGTEPKVMVDTGTTADWYHTDGVPEQEHIQFLEEGLDKFGVRPEDIGIVILTHLHADHVEQARKFTKARFIVQQDELDVAKHPVMESAYRQRLLEGLNYTVVKGDSEIMEGVRVLFTPGHTPGTQSVAVDTPGGVAIISGFCSIKENFGIEGDLSTISAPGVYTNLLEAYDSVIKVKQAADIVIPLHDPKFVNMNVIP